MKTKEVRKIKNLLGMDMLDQELITHFLDKAEFFLNSSIKERALSNTLSGKVITHLFFEPSTRTLNSFLIAAHRLGAIALNPSMSQSATVKGESLIDTVQTFEAMGTDLFIIRHSENYSAQFITDELKGSASVINAGDGNNQHPTQCLLDLLTIRQHKPDFSSLTIAIIGDIAHSRVAGSLIEGLKLMGTTNIRLVAPKELLPKNAKALGVNLFSSLKEGIDQADVLVALRIQKERIEKAAIPNTDKFFKAYGLTPETIACAKPDAIIMHPGPMNRGVEIDSAVADGQQSVILNQITNGVAVRMALMDYLLN